MKPFALVLAAAAAWHAPQLAAQSVCSSDGTPAPTALFERFLSADCEACWSDAATAAPPAGSSALVLDWIVPTSAGEDAALSAAATRDALARLESLGRSAPAATDVHIAAVQAAAAPARIRVAQGMAFNDYLGTGITWRAAAGTAHRPAGAMDFVLLLVEAVPAGTDGTPVARNLVRNMLQGTWDKRKQLSKKEQSSWMEQRPMRIPDGARPERLRVVGWVQDAQGRVLGAAQSACR